MSHAAPSRLTQLATVAITRPDPVQDGLTMRLLRHHTKNALQRIIAQLSEADLRATPAGNALAEDIERRIRLSARVSDALFGLTETPGPLRDRLSTLCHAVVALMGDGVQAISTEVQVVGSCPARLDSMVLQIAHELVTNAVKHGMHMRLTGRIEVILRGRRECIPYTGLSLEVRDNGWGANKPGLGDGLMMLQLIAEQHGGRVELLQQSGWMVGRLTVPGCE